MKIGVGKRIRNLGLSLTPKIAKTLHLKVIVDLHDPFMRVFNATLKYFF